MNPAEVFKQFVAAINSQDMTALKVLLPADHLFIDSLGNRMHGAEFMEAGWRSYFALCPDYWIHVEHLIDEGETVLAAGEAGGTIDGVQWRTPAAWKAVVRDGTVVEWQIFADNKPVYEILSKRPPR